MIEEGANTERRERTREVGGKGRERERVRGRETEPGGL